MSADLTIDGVTYISSKRAAEIAGYSQDYVGQLARSGKIAGKRIGGLWYVLADSVLGHKKIADAYVPTQPVKEEAIIPSEDASTVTLEGKQYVSAARAAKLTSYHQDYIGQLARSGKILSKQVGKRWYVDIEALKGHKSEKDALLAAVQTESVGIKKAEEAQIEDKKISLAEEVGLHYAYTPDTKPLFPPISLVKKDETEKKIIDTPQEVNNAGHPIPIRVMKPTVKVAMPRQAVEPGDKSFVRMPRISIFSKIIPVIAIIIVILLVFNLNLFAVPEVVKSGMDASNFDSYPRFQKISQTISGLGMWDYLTKLLSSELTYTRE